MSKSKNAKKTYNLAVVILLLVFITLVGFIVFTSKNRLYISTSNMPTKQINPTLSEEPTYNWGEYTNCTVYSRRNMNTHGSNNSMLDYSSEVRCNINNISKTILSVTDKGGYSTAANSIFRIWNDNDGYKVLIVDQNGAGSGEGNGKILLLKNNSYKLQSCFYFLWEKFNTVNKPIPFDSSLTSEELQTIKINSIDKNSDYCSNFTLTSEII